VDRAGYRGEIDPKRLGEWLRKIHGRVFAGYRLDLIKQGKKSNRYKLVEVEVRKDINHG
jgi:hypothetical protein